MTEYRYNGPVRDMYGNIRNQKWLTSTIAVSEGKALSNLRYRYALVNKCSPGSVKLNPKYLTIVREGVSYE